MTATLHPSVKAQFLEELADDPTPRTLLIDAEQAKAVERSRVEAEKQAARSEVERLERKLAAAKAKLRGKPTTTPAGAATSTGPSAKVIRAWAAENDVECPPVGRVPASVVDAYTAAAKGQAS